MKYCTKCGKELEDDARFCPGCGCAVGEYSYNNTLKDNEGSAVGYGILGFFIPIAGLILFLVWNNDQPKKAKASGIGALISVIASIVIGFILFIISFLIMGVM